MIEGNTVFPAQERDRVFCTMSQSRPLGTALLPKKKRAIIIDSLYRIIEEVAQYEEDMAITGSEKPAKRGC